jgi:alcohol dehydrogenase (cytochrome c)
MKPWKLAASASLACVAAALVAALAAGAVLAQSAGPFTTAQVTAGHSAFLENCAACHQKNLAGAGEAPALAGAVFLSNWNGRTADQLYSQIKLSMPLGKAGSLDDDTYAAIVAYVLRANGAQAGTAAFNGSAKIRIGSIANGVMPADVTAPVAAAASAGNRRRGAPVQRLGITFPGTVKNYTPVTDAMMQSPPDGDWLMHYRNYAGWSHSPLRQIDTGNVAGLQLKWVLALDEGERQQITPLVHDGVMFVSANRTNKVQAIDAATGTLIWENTLGPVQENIENATRTMVLYGDKLFYPATDTKLYALDARTGKIDWQIQVSSYGNDKIGGMMAVRGKVIIGLSRCDEQSVKDHCFIAAYDANTGKQVWKFLTIADKGMPGGDSWGKLTDDQRAGADAWISGTYDPDLNLVYWGTGQAKGAQRGLHSQVLFTNTTLALDADTGQLKWYFQDAPDESLDLDEVYEKVLVDDGDKKNLLTVGKKGILWKLDRANGKFLDYKETVFQNVFVKIDSKTGKSTYRPDILNHKPDEAVAECPSQEGGHDWPTTSYDPDTDLLVIPLSQTCSISGGGMGGNYEMPGTDGQLGRISAYEAKTLKPVWSFQQQTPFLTGVMTTAGGLGFVGDWDRTFRAFDIRTGKTLWSARLGTTVQGYPTSFAVDGQQYIAVPTGYNGGSPQQRPTSMLAGELFRPMTGHAVYVFALPKTP